MKYHIILFFALILSKQFYAHDIHEQGDEPIHHHTRHWHLMNPQEELEGSFLMEKNGKIYIETSSNEVVNFALDRFESEDKRYIESKKKKINEMNLKLDEKVLFPQKNSNDHWGFYLFVIFCTILVAFTKFVSQDQKKYIYTLLLATIFIGVYASVQSVKDTKKVSSNLNALDSAFNPFVPHIHTYSDQNYYYIESQGIPSTHEMMVGISNRGWQQQVPIPQCYIGTNAWPIPLNPVLSNSPIPVDSIHFTRGAIAIAVNGVPIFNVHTNTGVDSYLDGQLDNYGGHCGRADDYHYHIAPLHLYKYTSNNLPIAFGLDGYPVYGSTEPDGSIMAALDSNHGHQWGGAGYHYHGTNAAPYMIARMAGKVTEDNTHQLVPQAAAKAIRPALTPLSGALITSCKPNANNNGYTIIYTLKGNTDSIVYSWDSKGKYTYNFYNSGNVTTNQYNGFVQCTVPTTSGMMLAEQLSFEVFPNPAYEFLFIKKKYNISVKSMEIINLNGQVVFQSNSITESVNVKNWQSGLYFVKLKVDGGQDLIQKVFIQH